MTINTATEKPILFSPPLVRAILAGDKTQTRRVIKSPPRNLKEQWELGTVVCPYNCDRLWVRESWRPGSKGEVIYRADNENKPIDCVWKPSIHMKKEHCRIYLKIVATRPEKLHDITAADAIAEGVKSDDPITEFRALWEKINGVNSWNFNPWVWVIEFERVEKC